MIVRSKPPKKRPTPPLRRAAAARADAPGIADYYRHQFDVPTEMIRYGAPILDSVADGRIEELGLSPDGYHLVVARFEPENHVLEIVEGYPTLDDAIADMALLAWEDPGNHWLDYVVSEATGEVEATGLFGPGLELLVTTADGRRLGFEMPESYREPA